MASSFLAAASVLAGGLATIVDAFDYPIEVASSARVPVGASWEVPHDFASFSFPAHWFTDFCGR